MTKQTINLIGTVVVGAIVVLGLVFGVLPRWSAARSDDQDRQAAAVQNHTQQMLNTALAAQVSALPTLRAEVTALKQQIPDGPHLEQLIQVASSLPAGAALRSITPGEGGASGAASATPAVPQAQASAGFLAVPVTLVFDVRRPADAATVLDSLRTGTRLFAVDTASVAAGAADKKGPSYALTVTGRAFASQAETAQASAPSATSGAKPGATP